MKFVIYNEPMLETAILDIRNRFNEFHRLNISYEKPSKEKTYKQMGFIFAALVGQITDYLRECGFNVEEDDVRYKLYEDVAEIVPEMVVDNVLFGGKQRIKHLGEMDRELCSKFIDGIFKILDTKPMYDGIKMHPSTYYNYLWHLDPIDIEIAEKEMLPERNEDYLNWVRELPCMCCGIQHRSHAHHAKIEKYVSNSKKTPDWCAIPLCKHCHLDGAHLKGHNWLLEQLKWLPVDLETFCKVNYIRWKNKL